MKPLTATLLLSLLVLSCSYLEGQDLDNRNVEPVRVEIRNTEFGIAYSYEPWRQ